ncbi:S-(hydroxymethyl)glutathione dehydrogenase [Prodigiosinella aquatilis]|nr:S-(hydroxymethyl)glutathione dehydrogenase [Prodigiosinella sp. LS101]WJV54885.1 S-(hydroxymethyl)glutathione dehydrogenase [Prodigiosinella sp. LS101]WJV59248.1 S-(hydroxymethyl)glutathione dehydrogenase [Pectobacteriaceae bacterium C111]
MHLSFNISLFKKAIEEELNIVEWHPTTEQLERMRSELLELNGSEYIFEVDKIISSIYGKPIKRMIFNGLDTSKASSLLAKINALPNGK